MELATIVGAVLAVGVAFILLARWARRQNGLMGRDNSAWKGLENGISFKRLFFGTSSHIESQAGRGLAIITIVAVLAFLLLAGYGFLFGRG